MRQIILAAILVSLASAACTTAPPDQNDEAMAAASADGFAAVPPLDRADAAETARAAGYAGSGLAPESVGWCRASAGHVTTECDLVEQDSPWRCTCTQDGAIVGHCVQPGGVSVDACQRTCCD
jgi:hypothetical protein